MGALKRSGIWGVPRSEVDFLVGGWGRVLEVIWGEFMVASKRKEFQGLENAREKEIGGVEYQKCIVG